MPISHAFLCPERSSFFHGGSRVRSFSVASFLISYPCRPFLRLRVVRRVSFIDGVTCGSVGLRNF